MTNLTVQKIKMLLLGIYILLHLDLKDNSKESESLFGRKIRILCCYLLNLDEAKCKSQVKASLFFVQ